MKLLASFLVAGLCLTPVSWADISIFEEGLEFEGQVKSISVADDVRVRLVNAEDKESRVVELCDRGAPTRGNQGNFLKEQTMTEIRAAMARGRTVRVAYSSLFDTCIRKVQVVY